MQSLLAGGKNRTEAQLYFTACCPWQKTLRCAAPLRHIVGEALCVFEELMKTAKAYGTYPRRHSFATHCIQNKVNMRHVQLMPGHSSPKTTELYTKLLAVDNKKIASPLDNPLDNMPDFNKLASDSP